jgi:alkaline phosphatase
LTTLFQHGEKVGKSTGVVATSTVTHATPAAFYAHVNNRKNESEIALQFRNQMPEVVIGGGAKFFLPIEKGGVRNDKRDLTEELKGEGYDMFRSFEELNKGISTKRFYALMDTNSLPIALKRDYTLGDLTEMAINNLSQNEEGFLLRVEGSQIDWAGHDNEQDRVLGELKDFNTAINAALKFAEKDGNTLVLVTADHETGGMSINGGTVSGDSLKLAFTTKGHSGEMVGVFAKGPGEELFRGVYDNFMIGRKLFQLLDDKYSSHFVH